MKVCITAESTIDLPIELLNKYNIKTVPFTINLGDKTGLDGEIKSREIIEYVNKTGILPKTSAVNECQYTDFFKEILTEYDAIVHISLSSYISCAYQNAVNASKQFDNKIYIIDSKELSTGIALLAIYASKLANNGMSPFQIVNSVVKRIPNNQTSFVLKRVDYLYKGGRCSSLSYLSAALLKIRPQIVMSNGTMMSRKRYVGKMKNCIEKYVKDTLEQFNTPDLDTVFITYSTCEESDLEMVKNLLKERGFKNIYPTESGATITSHCGEGCLGILYQNDGNSEGVYIEK